MKKNYFLLLVILFATGWVQAQVWKSASAMGTVRAGFTMVMLADGKILAAGGYEPGTGINHKSAELYNPSGNVWTAVGDMSETRYGAKAVLLNTGKVLVIGGYHKASGKDLKSCELYDPVSQTFSVTDSMSVVRFGHTATLLKDGRVLVVGGTDGVCFCFHETAEIYDPSSGKWSSAGSMSQDRLFHTATLLDDGNVLIAGGNNWNDFQLVATEVYDPAGNVWFQGPEMANSRDNHSSVKLANGNVLITGGRRFEYFTNNPTYVAYYSSVYEAEIMDASGSVFMQVADPMVPGMSYHHSVLLDNGDVLAIAGVDSSTSTYVTTPSVTQVFHAATETWSPAPMAQDSRFGMEAVKLSNGDVLVCGGSTATCEVYDVTTGMSEVKGPGVNILYQAEYRRIVVRSANPLNAVAEIMDITGKRTGGGKMEGRLFEYTLNHESPGVYFVKITTENSSEVQKILVTR